MKQKILEELCRTAFDSMDNYFSLSEENGEIKVKLKDPENMDLSNIAEVSNGKSGLKLKLYSKERAIVRLGNYLGIWNEKDEGESEDLEAIRQMTEPE